MVNLMIDLKQNDFFRFYACIRVGECLHGEISLLLRARADLGFKKRCMTTFQRITSKRPFGRCQRQLGVAPANLWAASDTRELAKRSQ